MLTDLHGKFGLLPGAPLVLATDAVYRDIGLNDENSREVL